MGSKRTKKEVKEHKVEKVSEVKSEDQAPVVEDKKTPTFIRMITPCITHKGDFKAGQVLEADEDLQAYFKENAIFFEKLN